VTENALILVPGLLCDEKVWQPQIEALAGIVPIRVADHGMLDSLGAMAQAIIEQAPARFALAGHSMGGRVALEVWRRVPDRITGIALLDTGVHPLPSGDEAEKERAGRYALLDAARRDGMRAMAWLWLQRMVHPNRLKDQDLTEGILWMMASKTPDIYEAQIRALLNRPDATPLLSTITCPALVLCGNEDAWSPVQQHRNIAGLIAGSRLVTIPECGHMSTLERPEAVTSALREWLRSVRDGTYGVKL
jgi:pimeloyl-ACP methyl ester carboxylesterase